MQAGPAVPRSSPGSLPARIAGQVLAIGLAVLPAAAAETAPAAQVLPSPVVAVRCGRLIDGVSDRPLQGATVLIEAGRVIRTGRGIAIPAGARVHDLSEYTCLPGFIDCHTHLMDGYDMSATEVEALRRSAADMAFRSIRNARRTIEAGFTTVRDVGTYHAFTDVALRDAIDRGDVVGPRMQVAGFYVTIPGGGGELNSFAPEIDLPAHLRFGVVTGEEEMRRVVREAIGHRVDLIKIIASGAFLAIGNVPQAPAFTEAEIGVAAREASKAGLRVAAHAHSAISIVEAARAGAASIEHGVYIDGDGIRTMLRKGTYLVPDLYDGIFIETQGRALGWPEEYVRKQEESRAVWPATIRRAHEAGVRIAFGTDSAVYPHGDNGKQFVLMQEWLGMSPMQAIRSATVTAAALMGWEDRVGSLTAGRYGDLVAVRGNPLDDLRLLESIPFVMKGGLVIKDLRSGETPAGVDSGGGGG